MNDFRGRWALITGASSGIGEEFARRLAERGMNLILVARRADRLRKLTDELNRAHGVSVHPLAIDLLAEGQPQDLLDEVQRLGHPIHLLINNAGFGLLSRVEQTDLAAVQRMLALNVGVLTELTYRLIPPMIAQGGGAIINLASLAAFQPVVYMPAYAATKAFVLHFSEALWAELRDRRVHVMAVCPGFTKTEFFGVAGMSGWYTRFALTPQDVVASALKALRRRRPVNVTGGLNWLLSLLPRIATRRQIAWASERLMRPPQPPRDSDSDRRS